MGIYVSKGAGSSSGQDTVVKRTGCSSRGLSFQSQLPCGDLTPFPEDLTASSASMDSAGMWYTGIHAVKTHVHIKNEDEM